MGYVTAETIWMDRVAVILGGIHNYTLFFMLFWQLRNRQKVTKFTKNMKIMNGFALAALFFNGFFGFMRAPVSFGVWPTILGNCTLQSAFLCIIWVSGKLSLYLVCITRLDVAFRNSQYQLGSKEFKLLYLLIAIGYVTQVTVVLITWQGIMVTAWNLRFCGTATPPWVFFFLVSWDAIVSISTLYLFVKKLYQCQSNRHSVSGKLTFCLFLYNCHFLFCFCFLQLFFH